MLNRRDSTLLEQRLFEKTNLEPDLHEKIEQIYMHYKMACMMFPCLPDAVFGIGCFFVAFVYGGGRYYCFRTVCEPIA